MFDYIDAIAISAVTPARLSGLLLEVPTAGRHMAAEGTVLSSISAYTPAFDNDVVPGVPAWSPPV